MHTTYVSLAILLTVEIAGCGGSEFSASNSNAGSGGHSQGGSPATGGSPASGGVGATASGGGANGGTGGTGGTAEDDGGFADASAPCSALSPNATDIYVDQRYTGATPTGSQNCPYPTITAGLGAALGSGVNRTVHVAGALPTIVYNEADRLLVPVRVTLQGDGPGRTKITATGTCAGITCAVHVSAGGVLDGFTVTAPKGVGIVTGALLPSTLPAVVQHVVASDSLHDGVVTLGDALLGPEISANHNGLPNLGQGLSATGSGVVHVRTGVTGVNQFDSNGLNGINVGATAQLQFDGGEAIGNAVNGVRFDQKSAPPPAVHVVVGLKATTNGNNGLAAYGGSVRVRGSTLLGNTHSGLFYSYASGGTLDVGTAQQPGANLFGGKTLTGNNKTAGVFLCGNTSGGVRVVQSAEGDQWSTCPPSQAIVATCDTLPAVYSDLVVGPSGTVSASVVTCIFGP